MGRKENIDVTMEREIKSGEKKTKRDLCRILLRSKWCDKIGKQRSKETVILGFPNNS